MLAMLPETAAVVEKMTYTKDSLLSRLEELKINFTCYEHPIVLTVEAQAKSLGNLSGALSKNLMLKDKKHRYYMVSALVDSKVDLKVLSQRLGLGKAGLRMAPEEALQEILQVPPGCVTPFALINDSARSVSFLLDKGFKSRECCLFHPLSNDVTISLSANSFEKFLVSIGRKAPYVDLEANPVVGKDNPPDLASFILSNVPSIPEITEKPLPVTKSSVTMSAPEEKSHDNAGNAVSKPCAHKASSEKLQTRVASEGTQGSVTTLAEITDVHKFVMEIITKTSAAVVSELNMCPDYKDDLDPSVLDAVVKHISSDLESVTMSFKNTAYTRGFLAGVQSASFKNPKRCK